MTLGPPRSPDSRAPLSVDGADRRGRARGSLQRLVHGVALSRLGGIDIRLGWSWILLTMCLLGGAAWLRDRPGDHDLPHLAILILGLAAAGCGIQSGLHLWLGWMHGVLPRELVVTAVGYRGASSCGATGSAWGTPRWLARTTVPTVVLLVAAAATLGFGGEGYPRLAVGTTEIYVPHGTDAWAGANADTPPPMGLAPSDPWRVARWTWMTQGLLMFAPIPGTVGRGVLVALMLVLAGRRDLTRSRQMADRVQGSLAILLVMAGMWMWGSEQWAGTYPSWPFLLMLGVLVWCTRQEEIGAPPGAEIPNGAGTPPPPARLPLAARWRIRRAQKAERDEALDTTRLDDILEKLHREGIDSLSQRERATLRRVSQRLRDERRGGS